jgi:hypothetical protein
MKEALAILFGIPLCVLVYFMWFGRDEKIKWSWVIAGLFYAIGYIAIFGYWLKMM